MVGRELVGRELVGRDQYLEAGDVPAFVFCALSWIIDSVKEGRVCEAWAHSDVGSSHHRHMVFSESL